MGDRVNTGRRGIGEELLRRDEMGYEEGKGKGRDTSPRSLYLYIPIQKSIGFKYSSTAPVPSVVRYNAWDRR